MLFIAANSSLFLLFANVYVYACVDCTYYICAARSINWSNLHLHHHRAQSLSLWIWKTHTHTHASMHTDTDMAIRYSRNKAEISILFNINRPKQQSMQRISETDRLAIQHASKLLSQLYPLLQLLVGSWWIKRSNNNQFNSNLGEDPRNRLLTYELLCECMCVCNIWYFLCKQKIGKNVTEWVVDADCFLCWIIISVFFTVWFNFISYFPKLDISQLQHFITNFEKSYF